MRLLVLLLFVPSLCFALNKPCLDTRDRDGDGLTDYHDNCTFEHNPDQADADGDGYGDACDVTPNGVGPVPPGGLRIDPNEGSGPSCRVLRYTQEAAISGADLIAAGGSWIVQGTGTDFDGIGIDIDPAELLPEDIIGISQVHGNLGELPEDFGVLNRFSVDLPERAIGVTVSLDRPAGVVAEDIFIIEGSEQDIAPLSGMFKDIHDVLPAGDARVFVYIETVQVSSGTTKRLLLRPSSGEFCHYHALGSVLHWGRSIGQACEPRWVAVDRILTGLVQSRARLGEQGCPIPDPITTFNVLFTNSMEDHLGIDRAFELQGKIFVDRHFALNNEDDEYTVPAAVAHEMGHVVEAPFVPSGNWISESFAVWAEEITFPAAKEWVVRYTGWEDHVPGYGLSNTVEGGLDRYKRFLWFQFLEQHLGGFNACDFIQEQHARLAARDFFGAFKEYLALTNTAIEDLFARYAAEYAEFRRPAEIAGIDAVPFDWTVQTPTREQWENLSIPVGQSAIFPASPAASATVTVGPNNGHIPNSIVRLTDTADTAIDNVQILPGSVSRTVQAPGRDVLVTASSAVGKDRFGQHAAQVSIQDCFSSLGLTQGVTSPVSVEGGLAYDAECNSSNGISFISRTDDVYGCQADGNAYYDCITTVYMPLAAPWPDAVSGVDSGAFVPFWLWPAQATDAPRPAGCEFGTGVSYRTWTDTSRKVQRIIEKGRCAPGTPFDSDPNKCWSEGAPCRWRD